MDAVSRVELPVLMMKTCNVIMTRTLNQGVHHCITEAFPGGELTGGLRLYEGTGKGGHRCGSIAREARLPASHRNFFSHGKASRMKEE